MSYLRKLNIRSWEKLHNLTLIQNKAHVCNYIYIANEMNLTYAQDKTFNMPLNKNK